MEQLDVVSVGKVSSRVRAFRVLCGTPSEDPADTLGPSSDPDDSDVRPAPHPCHVSLTHRGERGVRVEKHDVDHVAGRQARHDVPEEFFAEDGRLVT